MPLSLSAAIYVAIKKTGPFISMLHHRLDETGFHELISDFFLLIEWQIKKNTYLVILKAD